MTAEVSRLRTVCRLGTLLTVAVALIIICIAMSLIATLILAHLVLPTDQPRAADDPGDARGFAILAVLLLASPAWGIGGAVLGAMLSRVLLRPAFLQRRQLRWRVLMKAS